jgi:hypothetical protein
MPTIDSFKVVKVWIVQAIILSNEIRSADAKTE